MFELYTYNDDGLLVFFASFENANELYSSIDTLQSNGDDTYWEWIEE